MRQLNAAAVVRCGVVHERVVARITQLNTVVVVRNNIITNIAVIYAIEIYSCFMGVVIVSCTLHCKPAYVHVIGSHVKDMIP